MLTGGVGVDRNRRTAAAPSIAEAFAARRNILNAVRLVLATAVIVRHADVVVRGTMDASLWMDQVFGQLPVDGFFALSGFLIAQSWLRRPDWRVFLRARVARIYPAFWVCLVVTAVVVAPLAALATGQPVGYGVLDVVRYVGGNATLVMVDNSIGGTPVDVPWPAEWNASLWTLKWEFACYLGVMTLGLLGLLRRRVVLWLLPAAWLSQVAVAITWSITPGIVHDAARFALMYLAGVALWLVADRVPARLGWALAALGVTLLLAVFVPGYRLLAFPLLTYGLVVLGVTWTPTRLVLRHDISYGTYIYGFPVEAALAHSETLRDLGVAWLSVLAIVLTVPLAAASWFLVERPAQRRLRRSRPPASAHS